MSASLQTLQVPAPTSGGLILSYRCSASCRHCMYACSPRWSADWMPEQDLETCLEQLARTIRPSPAGPDAIGVNDGLHFTGGEPFLNFELLCRAVEIAEELRIPSTFVETNCAWAKSTEGVYERLRLLREKGLRGILISVNPFYLEYVPFERTERTVRAALDVFGRNVIVYQYEYFRRFLDQGVTNRVPLDEQLLAEGPAAFLRNVEFFPMGRAPFALDRELGRILAKQPPERFFDQPCLPPLVRSWHNHVDNYGNYMPGFCGGISFGDCRNLETLVTRGVSLDDRPVLAFLAQDDLRSLYGFAHDHGYAEAPDGYFSKCHLCADLRRHLAARGGFTELTPIQFYEHLGPEPIPHERA